MKRLIAQTRKELTQLTRDRMALALALLLPLIQLTLMGNSFALIVRDLPIIVQDFDDSPASRALIDGFRASLTFRIVPWPTERKPEEAFARGSARGALIIPRDFGRNLARGVQAQAQILVDGSDANTAKLVAGYAGTVARSFNAVHGAGARSQPVGSFFSAAAKSTALRCASFHAARATRLPQTASTPRNDDEGSGRIAPTPPAVDPDARRSASSSTTSSPAYASTYAAVAPVRPPPMMTMSAVWRPPNFGYARRRFPAVRSSQ